MSSPKTDRAVIDIKATAEKHLLVTTHILPIHALTGSDVVAATYGIGKKSALNALKNIDTDCLSVIDKLDSDLTEVTQSATAFCVPAMGMLNGIL